MNGKKLTGIFYVVQWLRADEHQRLSPGVFF